MDQDLTIRPAKAADAEALAALYGLHVLNGTATFEEVPPEPAEMAARLARVQAAGLPWLVAEAAGDLAGYAYCGPYHSRSAYRFTVEDSVYIAQGAAGRGLGRALLTAVLDACAARGVRQVVAAISDGDSAAASVALHARLGFTPAGRLTAVGYKHDRWLDVSYMQRALGGPSSEPSRFVV